jgi:hypothetical protein
VLRRQGQNNGVLTLMIVMPDFNLHLCRLLPVLLLTACATAPGTQEAAQPADAASAKAPRSATVETRRDINGEPAAVLKRASSRIKTSKRYKLEDSGKQRIKLSLSADPARYVDCGEVVIPASDGHAAQRFPAAQASHQYLLPIKRRLYGVTRKLQLQAQAEIQLESATAGKTSATVRVDYRLKRSQKAVAEGLAPVESSDELSFRSGENATFPNAPTRCTANGKLEAELLDLLQ